MSLVIILYMLLPSHLVKLTTGMKLSIVSQLSKSRGKSQKLTPKIEMKRYNTSLAIIIPTKNIDT